MRAILSALLLLAQLPPLVGVALCQGLAQTEAQLMEEGCPMPEVSQSPAAQPSDASTIAVTSTTSSHGCVFAEACLTSPVAVIPATILFGSMPPSDRLFRPATALHGAEDLAPPIPPPNL